MLRKVKMHLGMGMISDSQYLIPQCASVSFHWEMAATAAAALCLAPHRAPGQMSLSSMQGGVFGCSGEGNGQKGF